MDPADRLLADLVSIPSVNPVCDPKGTGEGRIADYLADRLRRAGLDVECREAAPGRPNLLASLIPGKPTRRVVLAPHLDTVTTQGMTIDPFGAEIREGRLYGRGAADTKGSIASFVVALERLAKSHDGDAFVEGPEIVFAGLMGEESGNDGAEALLASGYEADFVIAGEPTSLRVVCRHRGALWMRLIVHGRSAHGSTPDQGRNAAWAMSRVLDRLRDDWLPALSGPATPDRATLNLGVVRAGEQVNVVPDRCEIQVDWRTVAGDDADAIVSRLRDLAKETAGEDAAPAVEVMRDRPALATDPEDPWVARLREAIRRVGGPEDALGAAPWFCDASMFAAHGIPAVAFGPGASREAHTAEESVDLGEVRLAADIVEDFLRHLMEPS
jgi:acetylornithine deacetylase/succinyl-diaminopimelate desuccinylase family protein